MYQTEIRKSLVAMTEKPIHNLIIGIDLMTHIDLKLKYNATRPALHGKKY